MKVAEARAAAKEARAVAIPPSTARIRSGVVLALARTETRKLLRHPAFLGALALVVLLTGGVFTGGVGGSANSGASFVGLFSGLFAATLLSANLAALRSRRDGTDELFATTASSRESRTAAHLGSVLTGPCLIALVLSAGAYFLRLDGRLLVDIEPTLPLQGIMVAAAFGAFGVALARWIPSVLAAPVAIVAHMATPLIWLVPWVVLRETGARIAWHFVYLAAITVFFAAAAFVRDRPRPIRIAVAVCALTLTAVGASLQIPPGGLV